MCTHQRTHEHHWWDLSHFLSAASGSTTFGKRKKNDAGSAYRILPTHTRSIQRLLSTNQTVHNWENRDQRGHHKERRTISTVNPLLSALCNAVPREIYLHLGSTTSATPGETNLGLGLSVRHAERRVSTYNRSNEIFAVSVRELCRAKRKFR